LARKFETQIIGCGQESFLEMNLLLSRLFRRLFLEGLAQLHKEGKLAFFGTLLLSGANY